MVCSLAFWTNLFQELTYALREPQFLNYHVRTNYFHGSTEKYVNLELYRLISYCVNINNVTTEFLGLYICQVNELSKDLGR